MFNTVPTDGVTTTVPWQSPAESPLAFPCTFRRAPLELELIELLPLTLALSQLTPVQLDVVVLTLMVTEV
jgi:hypothetical protein